MALCRRIHASDDGRGLWSIHRKATWVDAPLLQSDIQRFLNSTDVERGRFIAPMAHFTSGLGGSNRKTLRVNDLPAGPGEGRERRTDFRSALPATPEYEQAAKAQDRQCSGLRDHHRG